MPHELPKAYDPTQIEDKWSQYWLEHQLFRVATPSPENQQPVFTILLPPPNVTGRLHMGHMLNQTEMDILVRWHRMRGELSLWLPGTDHAGIATQMMVERQLAQEEKQPGSQVRRSMGREKFVERVWAWKKEYGGAITSQMKRLGASVDWSREYFTMDEGLSCAVREAFVRLYDEGLIYRGAYIVNWCPDCMTAISDLEVVHEETKGSLWGIRYPIVGSEEFITVATTRPETMLGDTAVAVNPNDSRYATLLASGAKLRLPLVGREIPLIADDWVSMEFGTGAVKVTPAHDPNDYQIGLRHSLPQINIFDDEARVIAEGPYKGLGRHEARKRVVADLEAQGLLGNVKDHTLSVGKCDRSKTVVEPRLSTQWFVATTRASNKGIPSMKELSIAAVRDGHINITPDQYRTVYLNWMEGLHDWCISRQLWWGHRIPAWHCSQCTKITVPKPGAPDPEKCQHCASSELMQDPDVLDTWFSSALLPISGFGWPDSERERAEGLDAFYPTSLLVTGFDILFFWVARMVMMSTHFMAARGLSPKDAVPFREVYIHALVRDADRQKMSKTKGNVIDPIGITEHYGTDAVRFTLASQASPGTDIAFNEQRTEGYRAFANKIWNATRFLFMNVDRAEQAGVFQLSDFGTIQEADLTHARKLLEVRWILSRFERTAQEVNRELSEYRFDEAARVLYQFFWGEFCDWYVELIKLRLIFDDHAQAVLAAQCLAVSLQVMEGALRLLAPFMPFLTEEIWHALYGEKVPERSIALVAYPQGDSKWFDENAEREMAFLQELIVLVRDMRAEAKLTPKEQAGIRFSGTPEQQESLRCNESFLTKLAGVSSVEYGKGKAQFSRSTPSFDVSLVYELQVDPEAERTRLAKEIAQLEKELEGKQRQLGNEAFLSKAPAQVVDGLRRRESEIQTLLAKYRESLDQLGAAV